MVNQRSTMPLRYQFGGYCSCSLTSLINSMEFPWSAVRAAAESCGSMAFSEPWAMSGVGHLREPMPGLRKQSFCVTVRLEANKVSLRINHLFC